MNIKEGLLEIGFLTGSKAYGTDEKDSDIDIVISMVDLQKVLKIIEGFNITESAYFKGFYFDYEGEKINVIPVHPFDFEPWRITTHAMTAILKDIDLSKEKKYAMFSGVRALVTMVQKDH